ncbi:MAG: DUF3368 domain-containing protein [Isosphaeraceae bacterium]|jgi:predicted nucleic acid-binding protein
MIVVSDTSPLNYLVLIEEVEVLPAIFGRVVVPPAVIDELQGPRAPDAVKTWIAAPPSWLEIRSPESSGTNLALGRGEREAICLASELSALCLIDDRKARREAERMGVRVTGLLGVLAEARDRGLSDAEVVVERLTMTSFRASRALIAAILRPER